MQTFNPKQLWLKACQFDNIPPDSKFVCFSSNNPYVAKYNEAIGHLQKALKP